MPWARPGRSGDRRTCSPRGPPSTPCRRNDRSQAMAAKLIDGKAVAAEVEAEVRAELARTGVNPGLTVVRVGDDPASEIYVRNKAKKAQELGIAGSELIFPTAMPEADLLAEIARLNADPAVDGILVQLPLPRQIDADKVINAIDPEKDVDGFHPMNVGRLHLGRPTLTPCTPAGVMRLLASTGVPILGAHAVVLVRTDIVGKPMAALLLQAHANVSICHSRTPDLPEVADQFDSRLTAIGAPAVL